MRARQKAGAIRHNGISGRIVVLGQIFPLGRIVKIVLLIIRDLGTIRTAVVCFFVIIIVAFRDTVELVCFKEDSLSGFYAGGGGGREVVVIIVVSKGTVEVVCDALGHAREGFFAGDGGGRAL